METISVLGNKCSFLQNNSEWQRMARKLIESFSKEINRYSPALPYMLTAWQNINTKTS